MLMRKACSIAVLIAATLGLAIGTAYAFKEFPTIGGNGGGEDRERCEQGKYLMGVKIRSGSWVDRITIICAEIVDDRTHRNETFGKKNFGGNGGGEKDLRCKPGERINFIGVVPTDRGARLVRQIDFLCVTLEGNRGLKFEAGNSSGRFPDNNNTQTCPNGEAAVGLHVRWGAYLDAIGLICDKFVAKTKSTTTTPPSPPKVTTVTPPAPVTSKTLGQQIVDYATFMLNKCVDRKLVEHGEACPALARGAIGDGECTDLVSGALEFVHAKTPTTTYVWGTEVTKSPFNRSANIQPGDIIQMFNTEFWADANDKNKGWSSTDSQHTAIIVSNNNGVLSLLEQNTWDGDTNRRFVTRGSLDLNWTLKRGNWIIYRAEKAPQGIVAQRRSRPVATNTSGHRNISRASLSSTPSTPGPQQRVKNCPCQPGFTHRLADAQDYVCVPVAVRRLIISETANKVRNQVSATDIRCKSGFVWRDAYNGDGVCVVPQVRDRVHLENRQHLSRVAPGCR